MINPWILIDGVFYDGGLYGEPDDTAAELINDPKLRRFRCRFLRAFAMRMGWGGQLLP